jgi:5,5'-dehydrodivanillate O-demethylase
MLSPEQNTLLTQVGPGTPAGNLLRRYWQALCPIAELSKAKPMKRVRILGEDLIVYRDPAGKYVCMEEHCAHRRASLYYGFIEEDGIRCCYHGWKYAANGQCIERPFERAEGNARIALSAYPVQALGGLLFVFMGPDPEKAPLLPRWDVLVRDDRPRMIKVLPDHHCNWVQIQENTVDSVHTYFLHGHMSRVNGFKTTYLGDYYYRPIKHLDWAYCEWGIEKTVVYGGDVPEVEIRPPLIFPNVLRIPAGPVEAVHFRVPIDDTNTRIYWVGLMPLSGPESMPLSDDGKIVYLSEDMTPDGDHDMSTFYSQDRAVMETQGAIFDRSRENLGATDKGIGMFRRMMFQQIQRVQEGNDPDVAVVRDPEQNRIIAFHSTTKPWVTVDA